MNDRDLPFLLVCIEMAYHRLAIGKAHLAQEVSRFWSNAVVTEIDLLGELEAGILQYTLGSNSATAQVARLREERRKATAPRIPFKLLLP